MMTWMYRASLDFYFWIPVVVKHGTNAHAEAKSVRTLFLRSGSERGDVRRGQFIHSARKLKFVAYARRRSHCYIFTYRADRAQDAVYWNRQVLRRLAPFSSVWTSRHGCRMVQRWAHIACGFKLGILRLRRTSLTLLIIVIGRQWDPKYSRRLLVTLVFRYCTTLHS